MHYEAVVDVDRLAKLEVNADSPSAAGSKGYHLQSFNSQRRKNKSDGSRHGVYRHSTCREAWPESPQGRSRDAGMR